jgi:hypothetical protein
VIRKTCSGLAQETNEANKLGTSLSMVFLFFQIWVVSKDLQKKYFKVLARNI